jgi:mannan endo-1,4-beta-mannosidase
MYTNYDDQGGKFGDTALETISDNPDQLGAYASLDSETGNLHLMLINKNPDESIEVKMDLSGFGAPSVTTLYHYSEANLDEIVSEEVDWSEYDENIELPPYSISHFVLEP